MGRAIVVLCALRTGRRHSVLVKRANDGRSSTIEIPYSDIVAVARRELGLFQLTAVQSVAGPGLSSAPPSTTTFDFWGAPDAVGEICRCLSNVVEDRRYSSVADQETGTEHVRLQTRLSNAHPRSSDLQPIVMCCAVEEVRRLRREAHGETLPGAQPDPEKESRRALLEWTRRQLYSTKSEPHAHIVAFHEFFPQLCKPGRAEKVAPEVQKFLREIADSLEMVSVRTACCSSCISSTPHAHVSTLQAGSAFGPLAGQSHMY